MKPSIAHPTSPSRGADDVRAVYRPADTINHAATQNGRVGTRALVCFVEADTNIEYSPTY